MSPSAESPAERHLGQRLVAILVAFYALSASAWALVDIAPPMWDQARHALDALRLKEFIFEVFRGQAKAGDIFVWHDNYYVWLAYLPTSIAHMVFGNTFDVAQLMMALFWTPLAFVSLFIFVRDWLHSSLTAFTAVAFLASSPVMADLAKDYLIDMPIVALLCLSLALMVRSDFLQRPRWAAACGAAAGGLVLVKAVAPAVFIVVPAAYTVIRAWRAGTLKGWLRGAAAATVACALVAAPVHARWWSEFMEARQWQQRAASVEGDATAFWPSALVHLNYLVDHHARGLMLPWLVVGVVRSWRVHREATLVMLASFFFCEIAWTLYPNKDVRFCLPDVAFVAVLAGMLWHGVKRQALAAGGTLAFVAFSTCAVQWGIPLMPDEISYAPGWHFFAQRGYLRGKPDRHPSVPDVMVEPIVDDKEWAAVTGKKRLPILRFDQSRDEPFFNVWNVPHAGWVRGRLFEMEDRDGLDHQADYLLMSRCPGEPFPDRPGFDEMLRAATPAGCEARLFRNALLLAQEREVRREPLLAARYQAQYMVQMLRSVHLDTAEWWPGQRHTVTFLVFVEKARWSMSLGWTLRLGDERVLATWKTAEPRYQQGAEYVHAVTFSVPLDAPVGEHALHVGMDGPDGAARVLDRGQTMPDSPIRLQVGRVRVHPAGG